MTTYTDAQSISLAAQFYETLTAQWTPDAGGGGGAGGGGSGGSGGSGGGTSSTPEPQVKPEVIVPEYPSVIWTPEDMELGDLLSNKQLNAKFSVPGKITYSPARGYKPALGSFNLTATFEPTDSLRYYALSVTKVIHVTKFVPEPTPEPTSEPSPAATPSPTPSQTSITQPTPTPSKLVLIGVVHFHTNDYFLDPFDRKTIAEVREKAIAQGAKQVIVKGNTDVMKGVDNMWLSQARAEAVSKYLRSKGFKPMVLAAWYSYHKPIALGRSQRALALNRRVEIYIRY